MWESQVRFLESPFSIWFLTYHEVRWFVCFMGCKLAPALCVPALQAICLRKLSDG